MISRRCFLVNSAAAAGVSFSSVGFSWRTHAQTIKKNTRIIVGFAPGGSTDTVARLLVGQIKDYAPSIIVESRPGAAGQLALTALKNSEADGSVIALTPGDQVTLFPHVYAKLNYNPQHDFIPVTTVCTVQFLLTIGPMVPTRVTTFANFIEWCRANPSLATYGTPGAGSRPHFLGTALAAAAGFEFIHVPYKGGGPAMQDLVAGQIAANFGVISNALAQIQSGNIRALVTTASKRSALLSDVPTAVEAGYPAIEGVEWFGILVPANTPSQIVHDLNRTIRQALNSEEMKAGLETQILEVGGSTPDALAQMIKTDSERWGRIVRTSGFTPME